MIMDDIPEELWSFPVPSSFSFQNDDISSSTLKMKLSNTTSELDFQRFLQEFSIEHEWYASKPTSSIENPNIDVQCISSYTNNDINDKEMSCSTIQNNIFDQHNSHENPSYKLPIMEPIEYQTYLKHRLDIACAKIKGSIPINNGSPQESTSTTHEHSQKICSQSSMDGPKEYDLLSNVQENKYDSSSGRQLDDNVSSLPLQILSPPQSEERCFIEDGLREHLEMKKQPYYSEAKKLRRLLQNRESARRSRKKKQVQENETEKQVSELKAEQDSKTKLVMELSHRFSEEVVSNRLLQAKIEILKAKVKMAEDTLKRVNPSSFHASMDKLPNQRLSLVACNTNPSFVLVKHDPSRPPYFLPSSRTYDSQLNKDSMNLSKFQEVEHTTQLSKDCSENSEIDIYLNENIRSDHGKHESE